MQLPVDLGKYGEQYSAVATEFHVMGGFAAGQKPRKTTHFPDFVVDPGHRLVNRKTDIASDVEDPHLQLADLFFDRPEHLLDLFFTVGIGTESHGTSAGGLYPPDQRFQLVRVGAGNARDIAFSCESLGDCTTRSIASPHHHDDFIAIHA